MCFIFLVSCYCMNSLIYTTEPPKLQYAKGIRNHELLCTHHLSVPWQKMPQGYIRRNYNTQPPLPPPPEVNSAAFQAAVSATVTATLAHIHNGNNGGGNGQGTGSSNQGMNQGPTKVCTYKDFSNAKPQTFNGTSGVIAWKHWIEKNEFIFEICECPKKSKVKFAACTFFDQALSWWNGHVKVMTLPVANAMASGELKEMLMA